MNKIFKENAGNILSRFSLKKTGIRMNLLELFLKEKKSYSQAEIISELEKQNDTVDRVTVYRNLNQLKAAGIVHEIENNKYVSCSHDCGQHSHVLLFCQNCEKHLEIKDHDKLNSFFNALGKFHFLSDSQAVFLKGVCEACAK